MNNNNQNNWPSHLHALDVSRGVAALSVVIWHWQHFAFGGNALPADFSRDQQPLYEVFKIFYERGVRGVEYFFLLSGFIFFWLYRDAIKNKAISGKQFFVQRFSRLYPLHFATLIVVAALQYFYTARSGASFVYPYNDTYHFMLNLGFASAWGFQQGESFNWPIWSVSIEILLYLIFFWVASFWRAGLLFCLVVSVTTFVLQLVIHPFLLNGVAHFFLGGAVFYVTKAISDRYSAWKKPVYFATLCAWLLVIVSFHVHDLATPILEFGIIGKLLLKGFPSYVLFPLTIACLALLEIDRRISVKSISWIGDITYSSYLLHFPLQLVCMLAVAYGVLQPDFYRSPLSLALFFAVLVPASYLTYKKFEVPMQKLLRRKLMPRRMLSAA